MDKNSNSQSKAGGDRGTFLLSLLKSDNRNVPLSPAGQVPSVPTKQLPFAPALTLLLTAILVTGMLLATILFAVTPLKQANAANNTVEIDWQYTNPQPGDVRDIHAAYIENPNHDNSNRDSSIAPDLIAWYCTIYFNQNVSYAKEGTDDSFVKNNVSLVTLQHSDGTPVEGAITYNTHWKVQSHVIYIRLTELLDPIRDYMVVIEPGITSDTGAVSTERYVIPFSTSEYIIDRTGKHSLYVDTLIRVGIPLMVLLAIAGATLQIIRFRKNKQVD